MYPVRIYINALAGSAQKHLTHIEFLFILQQAGEKQTNSKKALNTIKVAASISNGKDNSQRDRRA